jgi:hypothetical protein
MICNSGISAALAQTMMLDSTSAYKVRKVIANKIKDNSN